jgi:Ca2+-binding RTX toxin-like protein
MCGGRGRRPVVPGLCAFLVVVIAALGGAASARAATVSVALESPVRGTLVYEAGVGETNHVTVEMTPDLATWLVAEPSAPLVAGPGCTNIDEHHASCPAPRPVGEVVLHGVTIALGDMHDWASGANSCFFRSDDPVLDALCRTTIDGGTGNDTMIGNEDPNVRTTLSGGDGNDILRGAGTSTLEGGRGADILRGGFGDNNLDGGPGEDTLVGGGVEPDTVSYSDRVNPVFVSLNGRRDDGEAGERDLIVDIQHVVTGSGADVIVGDAQTNFIDAGTGNDAVYAGGGNDRVEGDSTACERFDAGAPGGADRLYGQSGDDILFGCGGNNMIYGGSGSDSIIGKDGADRLFGIDQADAIYGGRGNDTIGGGRGRDDLRGQEGNDTFYARDRQADRIVGWTGFDRAQIDRSLDRRSSIERLF